MRGPRRLEHVRLVVVARPEGVQSYSFSGKLMIQTDILIIGAGPCGLFTVFEAGLLKLKCHLIDALPQGWPVCRDLSKKPIFDIPAYPEILAGDLVDRLMEQAAPFKPGFTLGERGRDHREGRRGPVHTDHQPRHRTPRPPSSPSRAAWVASSRASHQWTASADYEDHGVEYIIKDPEFYRGKKVVISGGGDSALDWTNFLADGVASEVTLVHRREGFRGHPGQRAEGPRPGCRGQDSPADQRRSRQGRRRRTFGGRHRQAQDRGRHPPRMRPPGCRCSV